MIGIHNIVRSILLISMLFVGLGLQSGLLNLAVASEPEVMEIPDIQEDRSGEENCSPLSTSVDSDDALYAGGKGPLRDKDDPDCMCVPLPGCADDPVCPCVRYCQWI